MTHRSGTTLLEVLIAIFIVGIGLLALMTLFPLGAIKMAQAIKDERAAECAANAREIARIWSFKTDSSIVNQPNPVFVDPLGMLNGLTGSLGAGSGFTISRVSPSSFTTTSPSANSSAMYLYPWAYLLDDVNFLRPSGEPYTYVAGAVTKMEREGRYSWAWVVPVYSTSTGLPFYCTAVVYSARSLLPSTSAPTIPANEILINNVTFTGTNQISISYTGSPPAIRAGNWVLDPSQGNFYRIVGVTVTATSLTLESETPLQNPTGSTIVLMEDVVEVFQLPAL